jgi:ADP-heptose:LPS heptosyltransferase
VVDAKPDEQVSSVFPISKTIRSIKDNRKQLMQTVRENDAHLWWSFFSALRSAFFATADDAPSFVYVQVISIRSRVQTINSTVS